MWMSTKRLNKNFFKEKKVSLLNARSSQVKYRYKVSMHADKPDQKFK